MKSFLSTSILLGSFSLVSLVAQGQSADEAAIKSVIQAGWQASIAKNAEAVKTNWKHDPAAVMINTSRFNHVQANGWEGIAKSMDSSYQADPKPNRKDFTLQDYSIHSNGNMAFAQYDALVTPTNSSPKLFPYIPETIRYRTYQVLEKEGDQWKTLAIINTDPETYNINNDQMIELDINEIGYRFMAAKRYKEAIEVFKTNVKLYPNAFNTYDSLGEAYMAAGDKKQAIENYEKSLKLNPNSETGKAALAKLKQL